MKLTVKQVITAIESGAYVKFTQKELPFALQFQLKSLTRKLNATCRDAVETKDKILKKFGTPLEDNPTAFQVKNEDLAEYQREVADFEAEETDIEITEKISWEVAEPFFKNATASDLELDWLIEFPEEVETEHFEFTSEEKTEAKTV